MLYVFPCVRSVMYTVNGFYKHHVTVVADVGPVTLQLSTEDLLLKPTPGLPADAGTVAHPSCCLLRLIPSTISFPGPDWYLFRQSFHCPLPGYVSNADVVAN